MCQERGSWFYMQKQRIRAQRVTKKIITQKLKNELVPKGLTRGHGPWSYDEKKTWNQHERGYNSKGFKVIIGRIFKSLVILDETSR